MTRNELTEQIVVARLAKGLTWQELADAIGRAVLWTTSALLGQHPIPAELGKVLVVTLGLDESAVPVLAAPPMRGGLPTAVPTDPTGTDDQHPARTGGQRGLQARGVDIRAHRVDALQCGFLGIGPPP